MIQKQTKPRNRLFLAQITKGGFVVFEEKWNTIIFSAYDKKTEEKVGKTKCKDKIRATSSHTKKSMRTVANVIILFLWFCNNCFIFILK